jgi:hypothetical protein
MNPKKKAFQYIWLFLFALLSSCSKNAPKQPVFNDVPFLQDFSIKYLAETDTNLIAVASDRHQKIQVIAKSGVMHTSHGSLLHPGKIVPDNTYRFLKDKKITNVIAYENQLVYLTDSMVFSNAWAGRLFTKHALPQAQLVVGGKDFQFLISDRKSIQLIQDTKEAFTQSVDEEILELRYNTTTNEYLVLAKSGIYVLDQNQKFSKVFSGNDLTSFTLANQDNQIVVGTSNGYFTLDSKSYEMKGEIQTRVPVTHITAVEEVHGQLWFGSDQGAFKLREDAKYDYYYGERWIPSNAVKQIKVGPDQSVLILTNAGVGQIVFKSMTLADKATFFEQQVRSRNIRNGFNATRTGMVKGDISTGFLDDSDNDGLWTTMYLGAEVFKYAVTKDASTLEYCKESLDAMERLFDITPVPGFPARSFERAGHIPELGDPERWQHSSTKEWDWKSTTSSDEAIGHIFVYGAMAELIDEPSVKSRAITLIDTLMSHIIKNDMYLIDFDGKPTMWGKWNPTYVNSFPTNVGDRKLNSSNIIAMLQTAYHFTKKEKYKEKAFELMNKHGYLENLMRPMKMIGEAPEDADDHSKNMSDSWNHSDDEMYFLGYWGLYKYAFNDTLQAKYKESILDHWEAERPEKDGLWNLLTAVTGVSDFDLNESVWYLQQHPLDLINWNIQNSHRKDIDLLERNFRKQSLKEVLPPDERPIQRHNANMFNLDKNGGNGTSEYSAGDIWLLPYWLGRQLGVISAPTK